MSLLQAVCDSRVLWDSRHPPLLGLLVAGADGFIGIEALELGDLGIVVGGTVWARSRAQLRQACPEAASRLVRSFHPERMSLKHAIEGHDRRDS